MKVQVKKKHIEQARRGDCDSCPIALAISDRPTKKNYRVQVGKVTVQRVWRDFDGRHKTLSEWLLPQEARNFIEEFDAGKEVQPTTFELEDL